MKIDYDPPCESEKVIDRHIELNIGMGDLARRLDMDACQLREFLGGRMPIGPKLTADLKRILK